MWLFYYLYAMRRKINQKFAVIICCIVVAFIMCAVGCTSERKLANKAIAGLDKVADRYDRKSEVDTVRQHWCAINAPIVASTKTITKYLPGKRVEVKGETVFMEYDCDSALRAELAKLPKGSKPTVIRIPTPVYVQVDTQAILSSTVIEDTRIITTQAAQIKGLQTEVANRDVKISERQEWGANWRKHAFIGYGSLLLLIAALILRWYLKQKGKWFEWAKNLPK